MRDDLEEEAAEVHTIVAWMEFWLVAVKFVQTAEVHRSASTSLSSRADFFLNLANRKLAQGKVRKAKARNVFIPAHAFHRHKKFFGLRPFKI
uniref:Uncharacterized protein n=1 Tax=Caenorhabditis japonica TaxID=281687 RepID=A0A8R1ERD1_CAEJA